tara:strand:+ start:568 stop:1026 length:459 start_codon:yes stop_codon:yes gene_type:complete
MPRTYTEQALDIVDSLQKVAKRDRTICRSRGIQFHENGFIFSNDQRIKHAAAVQILANSLEQEDRAIEEAKKPEPTAKKEKSKGQMTWDSLNEATKAYFFQLANLIGDDVDVVVKIGLQNAPRLSNLKRIGLVAKTKKGLEITEAGRVIRDA